MDAKGKRKRQPGEGAKERRKTRRLSLEGKSSVKGEATSSLDRKENVKARPATKLDLATKSKDATKTPTKDIQDSKSDPVPVQKPASNNVQARKLQLKQKLTQALLKSKSYEKDEPKSKTSEQPVSTPPAQSSNQKNQKTRPGPGLAKKAQPETAKPTGGLSALQAKMKKKLAGGNFRFINEKLYTTPSQDSFQLFSSNPELFNIYHEGFRNQVELWPSNPVDVFIADLKSKASKSSSPLVIADLGCGEAKLAQELMECNSEDGPPTYTVHSFDLVAPNSNVVACDIRNVPLKDAKVDVAIFCLALMGTNFVDFLKEAWRILKVGGELKIAEVTSRFPDVEEFIGILTSLGFKLKSKDDKNKMFIIFNFIKQQGKKPSVKIDNPGKLLTPYSERYKTNVAEEEQLRREKERELKNLRVDFKRQWKAQIENTRWGKMDEDFSRMEDQWQRRHKASRIGKNRITFLATSVSYNPITLEYHESDGGKKLAEDDAKSLYRTAMRSAHLYLKNNTFNPMRCQDIPRRLVADLSLSPQNTKVLPPIESTQPTESATEKQDKRADNGNQSDLLDIPKQLIAVAAHSAALVQTRMGGKADDVLIAGKGTPRAKATSKGGKESQDAKATAKDSGELKYISVEVEGEGKNHNWSRHF
ncbi:25S rRNA (adenine645-N1)-methyltransferase [Phlyctochytrium planicorne]|nr:25S rRNA (adenine645-N1)-methyltransferase [Phlyctochytrium planicorne]